MKHFGRMVSGGALALLLLTSGLSGCARKAEDNNYKSLGMDHGVEGFLYNFDQRSEVKSLVRFYKKHQLPVQVSWYYGKENAGAKDRNESDEVMRRYAVLSDEEDVIQEIYFALSNTIIMGVATDQSDDVKYFVAFTLPDGSECRFDFVSENSVRIGNQNYVAESDGNLWYYLTNLAGRQDMETLWTESGSETVVEGTGTETETETEAGTEQLFP